MPAPIGQVSPPPASASSAASPAADATASRSQTGGGIPRYRVTVTNLTTGQPFTPPAVLTHDASVGVFSVGEAATEPTRAIAENGNLRPLLRFARSTDAVDQAAVGTGPLVPKDDPGATGLPPTAQYTIATEAEYLSMVAMLIATNDGFTGVDTVPLPDTVGRSKTVYAGSFDAGTETNTERFQDLVPPAQALIGIDWEGMGTGASDPDLATDGIITPHPGLSGTGDIDPSVFGWRDPAALVQVERLPNGPPSIAERLDPPLDPDGDGRFEDINADGRVDIIDVAFFLARFDSDAVQNNPAAFDFDDNGTISITDVAELLSEIS